MLRTALFHWVSRFFVTICILALVSSLPFSLLPSAVKAAIASRQGVGLSSLAVATLISCLQAFGLREGWQPRKLRKFGVQMNTEAWAMLMVAGVAVIVGLLPLAFGVGGPTLSADIFKF